MSPLKQAVLNFLEKLRHLVAPEPLKPVPVRKTEKELERWANEGGH